MWHEVVPDDERRENEYRTARQLSAGLLIALVVVVVVADQFGIGRPVEPTTLLALLLTAAGLLAVDVPGLRK